MTDHEKIQEILDQASEYITAALLELEIPIGGVIVSTWCPTTTPSAAAVIIGFENADEPEDASPLVSYLMAQLEQISGCDVRFLPINEG